MQTKTYMTAILTALLVLLMVGSAMSQEPMPTSTPTPTPISECICDYHFGTIAIGDDNGNGCEGIAGETINISVEVCAECWMEPEPMPMVLNGNGCEPDFDNVTVTFNASNFSIDEITLELTDMECNCAIYTGSVMTTLADKNETEIVMTDPSGNEEISEEEIEICPAECAYLEFVGIEPFGEYDPCNPPEPKDEALTQLWWCIHPGADPNPNWFLDYFYNYKLYVVSMQVYSYDEHDNLICPSGYYCCEDITMTVDSPATLAYMDGFVLVYNEETAADVTVRAHCNSGSVDSGSVDSAEHTISFLQPISHLEVTADVGALYNTSYETFNVSAQILDAYGDPIAMPNVPIMLYNDEYDDDPAYTDGNGTATFLVEMSTPDAGENVTFRAEAECREGSLILDVVDPVLGSIEVYAETPMPIYENQTLDCDCYNDHGGWMECPDITYSSTNGYVCDLNGSLLTALRSGATNVTASNGSVVSDPVTVYVDGESVWQCGNSTFEMSVGAVTLVVEWPEEGEQCFEVHPVGDPLSYYGGCGCNETDMVMIRGAHIDWNQDYNNTYTIFFEYDASEIAALDIEPGTLTILQCDKGGNWTDVGGSDNGIWVETTVTDLCMFALAGEAETETEPEPDPEPEERRRSSGGSGGIYPPDSAPTNATPTPTPTPDQGTEDKPKNLDDSPKTQIHIPYVGDEGENESIWEVEPSGSVLPGFAAVFAIAGILAVAYLIGRKKE